MYAWLKLVHILAVMFLAVGSFGSLLVATRARRASTSREVVTLMRTHKLTVTAGIIPGALGSLATGAWLVDLLGAHWSDLWIAGTSAGWIASLLLGVIVLLPAEAKAIAEGDRLVASGVEVPSTDLRRYVGAPTVYLSEWATVVLLVAMTVLMIFKPR